MDGLIQRTVEYITAFFEDDSSGHDAQHTLRVWRTASEIAEQEGADAAIVQLAALLHDVDDRKLSPGTHAGKDNAVAFMRGQGLPEETVRRVVDIISAISFSDGKTPATLEGKIVQDADRLDAIGAIGIARTFAFGGSCGRKMHDPAQPPALGLSREEYAARESTSVNHFYEKLLLLKESMNTAAGKRLAEERHRYMEGFLEEFLAEWDGRK